MTQRTPSGNAAPGQSAGATLAADLASIQTDLDTFTGNQAGRLYYLENNVTAAANAGATTLATVGVDRVVIVSVTIESNGATTADLTSAAVACGAAQVNEIISAATAAKANIDAADETVFGFGGWSLDVADTVSMDLQGGGATAVDFAVTIGFRPLVSGATLT